MRGVLLTALGTDEAQIEAFFREAISTAKEQKSVSNAQKRPMQNTGGKERAGQEDVDSDYLFGNCFQRSAFRLTVVDLIGKSLLASTLHKRFTHS